MATARLPGIYFESVSLPPAGILPRMDIAAFAGFLPSGPIGVPFVVEDPNRFQDVFGTDLNLAWDRVHNQMRQAQTPPAVRTFFRNGGQRCWVLRLAKLSSPKASPPESGAQPNAWTIPGLLQVDANGGFHAGWVQARSEGSWSDELTVNATLLEAPLPAGSLQTTGSLPVISGLDAGDLVQLYFPQTQTLAYYEAGQTEGRWFWFQPALTASGLPPSSKPDNVFFLDAGVDTPVPFLHFSVIVGTQGNELLLEVSRDTALAIPPGSWLRMQFGKQILLAQVENVAAGQGTSGSSPADETATLTSTLAWWNSDPAAAWAANKAFSVQTSIVTFELWAWPQGAPVRQIADLGFSTENPRYWGLLPTDAVLYTPQTRPGPLAYAALATDIDYPRFPLAGPTTLELGLPLGMTGLVQNDFTQGASQPGATALDRDGLASWDQSLFLDNNLISSNSATLLQQAYFFQYQAPDAAPLTGVHALLSVDEISLIAVPDAIHGGWQRVAAQTALLAAPDPIAVSTPDENGNYIVSWTQVPGATGYILQQANDSLFATALTSWDLGATGSMALSSNSQCPIELYYRVSASGLAGSSPWSQTAYVELGTGDFTPCGTIPLDAPHLQLIEDRNRVLLNWTLASGPVDSYILQTAGDQLFESASTLYQGQEANFDYWATPGPPAYFRVNTQRGGESSPWSNTVNTAPQPVSPWEATHSQPPTAGSPPPQPLSAIHLALLRMAAARADMVAILSVPYSYHTNNVIAYEALLTQTAVQQDPERILSYGALYHPWIVTPDTTNPPPQSLRSLVPDGGVCGIIASTTSGSGAWIAPANLPLSNVVALAPPLESGAALAFSENQINLIAQEPEGFLVTSQDTLMPEGDPLQPLNVRRLLILLRRLALQEGVRYVFQNISPSLQRAITRQFQQWMQQLLLRGAFAGSSAQDSYQVIADATVNTQSATDQGQFIVELRVAPSVPMQFLTVKLVQSGGQLTAVEV